MKENNDNLNDIENVSENKENNQTNNNENNNKQIYLIENILKKNYDPKLFVKFLNQFKNVGEDINLYDFEEIVRYVDFFIKDNINENQKKDVELSYLDLVNLLVFK